MCGKPQVPSAILVGSFSMNAGKALGSSTGGIARGGADGDRCAVRSRARLPSTSQKDEMILLPMADV
jgi:hypothetical protein